MQKIHYIVVGVAAVVLMLLGARGFHLLAGADGVTVFLLKTVYGTAFAMGALTLAVVLYRAISDAYWRSVERGNEIKRRTAN